MGATVIPRRKWRSSQNTLRSITPTSSSSHSHSARKQGERQTFGQPGRKRRLTPSTASGGPTCAQIFQETTMAYTISQDSLQSTGFGYFFAQGEEVTIALNIVVSSTE